MTREELLVTLGGLVLALPEDRPHLVAVDGMPCVGKTVLAAELGTVVSGAGRHVVPVSYDDFHHPAEVRHRRDRLSAEGYLLDSYDAAALRRLVLEPATLGRPVTPKSFDLAADEPVQLEPVAVRGDSIVMVDGEFVLAAAEPGWDLAVLLVADPTAVLERALVRDADLGTPAQVRELYVRRYLAAWSLYEDRADPWSRADVVVDLTDPLQPRLLGE